MGLQDELVASFTWVDGHADIWAWFARAELFASVTEALAAPFKEHQITKVVGIEARGFLLAGAVARELGAGVVPIRKPGAIFPGPLLSIMTSPDYRGRTTELLRQEAILSDSDRVLVVDDWLETGSQVSASIDSVEAAGALVVGVAVIVDGSEIESSPSRPLLHAILRVEALGPSD
jgi:adenine phosphoribosyltransferase